MTVVSFGWARPRTRKKSEQFSRSFMWQAQEYISPWTVARKRSAQSSRKSSAGTFSPSLAACGGTCPPQKFRLSFENSPLRTDRSPMEGLGLPILYILSSARKSDRSRRTPACGAGEPDTNENPPVLHATHASKRQSFPTGTRDAILRGPIGQQPYNRGVWSKISNGLKRLGFRSHNFH